MSETSTPQVADHLTRLAEDFERMGTTLKHDRFLTAAATDDIARRADGMQCELGSGPCVDVIRDQTSYHPSGLEHDTRWPEYGRRVGAELGLRSSLCYRMNLDPAGLITGLNFYAAGTDAFTGCDRHGLGRRHPPRSPRGRPGMRRGHRDTAAGRSPLARWLLRSPPADPGRPTVMIQSPGRRKAR